MPFYRFIHIILLTAMASGTPSAQNLSFDILDGDDQARISFEYVHNFILIDVRLFGVMPLKFIFDTGAEHTILFNKEFADMMDVEYDLRIPIIGADQSRELSAMVTRSVDIEIDGLALQQRDILVLDSNYFHLEEIIGTPVHGILGGSFFKNVIVEIDYRKGRMQLYTTRAFDEPGRSYRKFDVDINSGKPYLDAHVTLLDQTKLPVKLLIDTGAGLPLLLHTNTHENLKLPENVIRGKLGIGLGGLVEGAIGRIQQLTLRDLEFNQVLTSFQDVPSGVQLDSSRMRNGLIGNQILSRFSIYIDYVRGDLYVKPKFRYKRKFKIDKSGMMIFASGNDLRDFVVQDVIKGSPAEEAGIRTGDIIRRIQGLGYRSINLDYVTSILQKREGKRIRLVIERNGERMKIRFRLRELI